MSAIVFIIYMILLSLIIFTNKTIKSSNQYLAQLYAIFVLYLIANWNYAHYIREAIPDLNNLSATKAYILFIRDIWVAYLK